MNIQIKLNITITMIKMYNNIKIKIATRSKAMNKSVKTWPSLDLLVVNWDISIKTRTVNTEIVE